MTERERFEAWMRDQGEDYLYRRDLPGSTRIGEYCRMGVQQSWECWQASRLAALEDAARIWDTGGVVSLAGISIARAIRSLKEPTC